MFNLAYLRLSEIYLIYFVTFSDIDVSLMLYLDYNMYHFQLDVHQYITKLLGFPYFPSFFLS